MPNAFLAFNGNAGIVCYFLIESREGVEKRSLTGVRISGKCDRQMRFMSTVVHSLSRGLASSTDSASRLRSARL
jgi:hypothetical protein